MTAQFWGPWSKRGMSKQESAAGRHQRASGTGVYPVQGEAQGAWRMQPLEGKVKVEQGLLFAEITAFNY